MMDDRKESKAEQRKYTPLPTRIGFSTARKWNPLSPLIRAFTRSQVSHTFLIYYDEAFEQDMVMEAHSTGFRLVTYRKFRYGNRIVEVWQPETDIDRGLREAVDWLGLPFDAAGLVGMAKVILERVYLHVKHPRNWVRGSKKLFCSESVVRALKAAGYAPARELNPDTTSPQDVLDMLRADQKNVLREKDDKPVGDIAPVLKPPVQKLRALPALRALK